MAGQRTKSIGQLDLLAQHGLSVKSNNSVRRLSADSMSNIFYGHELC
jgi:hypothetical protein